MLNLHSFMQLSIINLIFFNLINIIYLLNEFKYDLQTTLLNQIAIIRMHTFSKLLRGKYKKSPRQKPWAILTRTLV